MHSEVTSDDFLGGALTLLQPKHGYRAGIDPVLLAAACPAKPNETVLELGCGVGAAALCLAHRTGAQVLGVERQAEYATLGAQNAAASGLNVTIRPGDLADLPHDIRQLQFHHVIANPPYFETARGTAADNLGRQDARAEETPLATWLQVAATRLRPRGWLTLIHRADRLDDILSLMPSDLGSLQIQPMAARTGRDAHLLLLRARKGGRAALRLHAPFVMHSGAAHRADTKDYSTILQDILRAGAVFPFPD